MNYYPHHIGDFDKATRHLTRIERSIYRDLLDVYYDTEGPLTTDMRELCRKVIARDQDERDAVDQVLKEFFTLTDAGWHHERCEEEIAAYQRKRELASGAGRASAQRRANKKSTPDEQPSNGNPTDVERTLNGRATNQNQNQNQEPEEQEQRRAIADAAIASASSSAKVAAAARPPAARGSRLPADWVLPMGWGQWAQQERPEWSPDDIRAVADRFRDHWLAKSGKDATKVDWEATWRNWVRNERTMGPRLVPAASAPSGRPLNRQEALEASNREIAARVAGSLT